MAPIVAPQICRYTVNQVIGGQPVANILDIRVFDENPLDTRENLLFEVGGDILNNWDDHILDFQINELQAISVSWIDLDSLDGSRGERQSTSANTWPKAGGNASDPALPAVTALRVDKGTTGGRGTKSGRMYIAGVAETHTPVDNTQSWSTEMREAVDARLEDFLSGIAGEAGPDGREQDLVVVHTRDGVYRSYSVVNSLACNPAISTQVRRGTLR